MTEPAPSTAPDHPVAALGTVLVIDDEPQIRRAVRHTLADLGARVLEAATGRDGMDLAAATGPDLVVLDLGLPDVPGDEVCREIRAWSRVPIVVLSARHSEQEKVRLLDAGADDYLTKPFGPGELAARVRAHLRRARMAGTPTGTLEPVRVGDLLVDFHRRVVERAGERVHLTPIEWGILRTLVAEAGRTLTHRQLFDAVWGRQFGNAAQYLRVHVTNLRRKIEREPSDPTLVVTEPGVGYRFEPPRE